MRILLPLLLWQLACAAVVLPCRAEESPAAPTAEQVLERLRPEHPRLLLDAREFEALKARVANDPVLREWVEQLRREADKLLDAEPVTYSIPDGKRLLMTCRTVLQRTYTLALLHRLDNDPRRRDRLWRELETAAKFKDWNPSHFLDTAEMTHAFAIGYDWLYHDWSDQQRQVLRAALVKHGLTPGVNSYRGEASYGWWRNSNHNWNQVCNGGLTLGALALADEEPQLAGEILTAAINSVPRAMASYAPDGAWGEGPGYWHYATTYNVVMIAALDSALGTNFGLANAAGFEQTGMFPIHLASPTGKSFNFADAGAASVIRAPELFWLARRFDQPRYADYQRQHAAPHALDVIWYPLPGDAPAEPGAPGGAYFRQAEVVTLRSAWNDPNALFVGLKAGDNKVNHSHLDLGSFVLDALGERWVVDLGSENYNLPGYFGRERWNYYRLRAEGHNTLVINPSAAPDQDPRAATRIMRFDTAPEQTFAIADLTPAYAAHASRVQRGIRLLEQQAVLIQDEVDCKQPSELWWFLHTPAKVTLDDNGKMAMLEQRGKRLLVSLVEPSQARWEVLSAEPLPTSPSRPNQRDNRDVRKLAIHLSDAEQTRIIVRCEPATTAASNRAFPAKSLAEW